MSLAPGPIHTIESSPLRLPSNIHLGTHLCKMFKKHKIHMHFIFVCACFYVCVYIKFSMCKDITPGKSHSVCLNPVMQKMETVFGATVVC